MQTPGNATSPLVPVVVRSMQESDLSEAKRIFHLAFGTFLGLPDPMQFAADRDFIAARFHSNPDGAITAESGGQVIGSNLATRWGSVGFFGPLTIRPDFWDKGVAVRLLESTMEIFKKWETRHLGLFTFPHSTKHVHLYQKFGFWPRFLTALMSKTISAAPDVQQGLLFSRLSVMERGGMLKSVQEFTDGILAGLDVRQEIQAVANLGLGETVLITQGSAVTAVAICHCGAGTEGGAGTCYIKFGAARNAGAFERLLDACEAIVLQLGLARIEAGMNTGRFDAYQRMLARGFRTHAQGVAMHHSNDAAYSRPEAYVIDDWR